ncbi:hypothetical protein Dimus_010171, partial [Dionaea muscipula]
METEGVCSNAVVLERLLRSAMEALVAEAVAAAAKSLSLLLFLMGTLPIDGVVLPQEPGAFE